MRLIKKYIKDFIRNSIRNFKYFKKRIYLADLLTAPVLDLNKFVEIQYKENRISILDIGCYGEIPNHLTNLKNFNFYGIDIDKEEIDRQKINFKGKNFNFFNYKVVEPDNLEKLRKNFIDDNLNKNLYTIEEVQGYNHKISNSTFNKNQSSKLKIIESYSETIKEKDLCLLI